MAMDKSKWLVILVLPVIVVLVGLSYLWFAPSRLQPVVISINTEGQPSLGKASAKVHIVVFEDLKCFNCARFNNSLLPQLKRQYIDTGIARYTMFNLAFLPGSLPAANAARCLYVEKPSYFFDFVNHIYRVQPPENEDWATTARLLQFAKESVPNANFDELSQCIIEGQYNHFLEQNLEYADKIMQGHIATPTVYINGRLLQSFSSQSVKALVKQAQEESR